MFYTFEIIAENKPGVLYRLLDLFLKRKINIEQISAFTQKDKSISKVLLTANIDEKIIETVAKQINKIIEVKEVKYHKTS